MTFPKKEEVFASETEATAAVACCHNGFQCYLILLNPHLVGKHWKSISGWPTVFRCWPAITSRFPLSYSFRLFFFVVLHPLVVVVVWTLFVAPATVEVVEKRRSSSGGHWTTFFVLFMNKYCINNLTFLCVVRESVFVFFLSLKFRLFWRPPNLPGERREARRVEWGGRRKKEKIEEFSKLNCYSLQQVFVLFGGAPLRPGRCCCQPKTLYSLSLFLFSIGSLKKDNEVGVNRVCI